MASIWGLDDGLVVAIERSGPRSEGCCPRRPPRGAAWKSSDAHPVIEFVSVSMMLPAVRRWPVAYEHHSGLRRSASAVVSSMLVAPEDSGGRGAGDERAVRFSLGLDVFGAGDQLGGERYDARDLFEVHGRTGELVSGGQRA
jgi:hypothetical protein